MRRRLRRVLLILAIVVLIALPFAFVAVRRFEASMTFHSVRFDNGPSWRLPRGAEDVWFQTASGVRLHGWFFSTETKPAAATVIYFHGNGGNLSYVGWLGEALSQRGFDVLLFDYKGYGRSEGRTSDERSVYEDADAAYDFLTRERNVVPESIVLYGQSLGTTAAVDLASRKPCAALVLESGLSSASDMAALILPVLPRFTHKLTRNRFDSVRKLKDVRRPVLVAHGGRDEIIPDAQGRALYEAANEPKRLIIIPDAGHNDLVAAGGAAYLDSLAEFIKSALGVNGNKII